MAASRSPRPHRAWFSYATASGANTAMKWISRRGTAAKLTQILAAGRALCGGGAKGGGRSGRLVRQARRSGSRHAKSRGARWRQVHVRHAPVRLHRHQPQHHQPALVLDQLKLLRHHDVDVPEARGFFIDGRPPHATAVLVEKATGTNGRFDSWTVGYGQALEVMPLERWKSLD